ncbi:hypothetical protein [Pseudorhodoferax soli]|uniref:Uncharacterized protein n=1 Tax=Pseudorhodoferax soli TaxID=545864 RepID=A0A368XGL3_9BURK|nr:hypothetical protein [Pseudorhodoferax soli]RCW65154.1 hypothetical protein DES41_11378 [Pseudorhodoferax soli]
MTYPLTRQDLDSISDAEPVFGTDRLLPPWEAIPNEFKVENFYTRLVDACTPIVFWALTDRTIDTFESAEFLRCVPEVHSASVLGL